MRGLWQRFVSSLTPGVRWALSVWTVFYLLSFLLAFFSLANLGASLLLTGPAVWHGQIWRLASYALLPANLLDWLMNGISVVVFGGLLERIWRPRELLGYCLIAALGAGLAKLALQPASLAPLLGPSPISLALMVATGWLFAHQTILVPPNFQLTIRQVVILLGLLGLLGMVLSAGWANALIRLSGGGFGLAYLWLRGRTAPPRTACPVISKRINRLEL
jgi:membrane associated rhomboid family serine protease